MTRRRRVNAFVARAVAVALLVGCTLSAVVLVESHRTGNGTPAAAGTPVRHEQVRAVIASGRLLFVGASYTVGLGATAPAAGYAPVLASDLDRRYTVAAVSGTGFLNPGPRHQGTFGERMMRLPAGLDPRIVVIQGGRNDAGYPRAVLQNAVHQTVTLARHRFEHAQVVVMGPIPATVPAGPQLFRARDAVEAGARSAGAGFVDPLAEGWITRDNERGYAGPVPAHPNDAGYHYIARRLLADLPAALGESAPPAQTPVATTSPAAPVVVATTTRRGE